MRTQVKKFQGLTLFDTLAQKGLANLFERLAKKGIRNRRLLRALEVIPRSMFVDYSWVKFIYDNMVLPIDCGEYIEKIEEQLKIIDALDVNKTHHILEVGTGSGFSGAILAYLSGRVTTIERYKGLCEHAKRNYAALSLKNIVVKHSDGQRFLSGIGHYDRIIVWPALPSISQDYMQLLKEKGLFIAPVEEEISQKVQSIMLYEKRDSTFEGKKLFSVRYQPIAKNIAAAL